VRRHRLGQSNGGEPAAAKEQRSERQRGQREPGAAIVRLVCDAPRCTYRLEFFVPFDREMRNLTARPKNLETPASGLRDLLERR
jgi:hypothetical protein